MAGSIQKIFNLAGNMGGRYLLFRSWYEMRLRSGMLKWRFPRSPAFARYITLRQWKDQKVHFFFGDRSSVSIPRNPDERLRKRATDILKDKYLLFGSISAEIGADEWMTNPDTGYRYDQGKHWTEIADFSPVAGDIKYVWERSRFSYLYDLIRYDHHFGVDCADSVFRDIVSWIDHNPVNCGPNYRCSQEISLRVLNWTFALHFYKESPALTTEIFDKIQYAIYWQMEHVYHNIRFSRIAVRNNHAITECLGLYLAGTLYPSLPGAEVWKQQGRKWFEEEIAYQVYDDGTYLQFSMNYHRVVVQLLTWAIVLAEKNGDQFGDVVYDRAKKSVIFLRTCMVDANGWLPNYGANDGALFFKLNDAHFRDYRPHVQALAHAVGMEPGFGMPYEDAQWYGLRPLSFEKWMPADGLHTFARGGYYVIREPDTLTFIRCGNHKDRPSQADNLHLDIWYKGENVLPDAGSYKYNTDEVTRGYFNGTASHNTVMLGSLDQMLRGGRFTWFYWSQSTGAALSDEGESYVFEGAVNVFRYIDSRIVHRRRVVKKKGIPEWEVTDELVGADGREIRQVWHMPAGSRSRLSVTAHVRDGQELTPVKGEGWYSSEYGKKEKTEELYFSVVNRMIETRIIVEPAS